MSCLSNLPWQTIHYLGPGPLHLKSSLQSIYLHPSYKEKKSKYIPHTVPYIIPLSKSSPGWPSVRPLFCSKVLLSCSWQAAGGVLWAMRRVLLSHTNRDAVEREQGIGVKLFQGRSSPPPSLYRAHDELGAKSGLQIAGWRNAASLLHARDLHNLFWDFWLFLIVWTWTV